jgi:hypothetical protein
MRDGVKDVKDVKDQNVDRLTRARTHTCEGNTEPPFTSFTSFTSVVR